ncbi:DNA (cytosine-5-)-methyltransferase [Pseudobacteroides cellulosolvens]|uniref:Cytosine-specific methyltransferase n=1 Tax=Pseudobacteroides cellulosolvens ATCC 35603 = DSM 2933 TaxID=398512 RepID=A0A0L6JXD2_9FIRM|nr:DNA (cytosine-5-)-methyltransferase [Pseudobacteroides cellulosolvens]KNY30225.1 DNA-cytosine methyltransferase [Pseudobacteroides cellulosolvens ATCC 35603 = DSM 2933]
MKKFNNLKFIDLFAGIGGFRLAMDHYGGKCVFSSEIDEQACITYEANYGEKPSGDITKIKSHEIPSHDILCGGFPCQAFSISGKQKGFEDTRGTLFFEIARITEFHKPLLLFLENVKNLVRHDGGKTFNHMLGILDSLGYTVFYKILNAGNYGVPQFRERVYMLCFRKDLGVNKYQFPEPLNNHIYLQDILLPDNKTDKYVIKRDDMVLADNLSHNNQAKPIRIGTINKGGQGERIYSPYGHAITLSAHGGGAAAKTGAYLVNGRVRKLAPRECCLAQGFPDDFKIPVSDGQAYKQFGNSVAVPVLKSILKNVVELNELQSLILNTHSSI